jgi:hypothetical protein
MEEGCVMEARDKRAVTRVLRPRHAGEGCRRAR